MGNQRCAQEVIEGRSRAYQSRLGRWFGSGTSCLFVCLSLHPLSPSIFFASHLSFFHWCQRWSAHLLLFCVFSWPYSPAPGSRTILFNPGPCIILLTATASAIVQPTNSSPMLSNTCRQGNWATNTTLTESQSFPNSLLIPGPNSLSQPLQCQSTTDDWVQVLEARSRTKTLRYSTSETMCYRYYWQNGRGISYAGFGSILPPLPIQSIRLGY